MADNEPIGGISVEIVGNYSHLIDDLSAANDIAAKAGADIAESFTAGASSADNLSKSIAAAGEAAQSVEQQINGLSGALEQVHTSAEALGAGLEAAGSAATAAAGQLSAFGDAAQIPQEAGQAVERLATDLEAVAPAAQQASGGMQALGAASEEASASAQQLGIFETELSPVAAVAESASAGVKDLGQSAESVVGAMSDAGASAKTFEEQVAALVASGSTLNEALAKVLPTSEEFGQGLQEAGTAAQSAAGSLEHVGSASATVGASLGAVGSSAASAAGQVNALNNALNSPAPSEADQKLADLQSHMASLQDEAAKAATKTRELAEASEQVGQSANNAADTIQKFVTGLLAIGGITISIQALKALGMEALEAADRIDDATNSIARLTGSLPQATTLISELRSVANDAALGMPELVTAATRMTAFLGSAEPVPEILRHLADSAAAMGTTITTAAGAFDRLIQSGDLSKRSLVPLGLTMADVAKAMGLTEEQAKKAWKAIEDVGDKTAIANVALEKFAGLAKQNADDALGGIARLKNAWSEGMEQIGNAIGPIVVQALPSLTLAMKGVATAGIYLVEGFQIIAGGIATIATVIFEAVKSIGSAWLSIMSGDFSGAASAIKSGIDNIKAAAESSFNQFVADMKANSEAIDKIWQEQAKQSKQLTAEEEEAQAKRAAAAGKAAAAAVAAAAEIKKQQKEYEAFAKQVEGIFAKLPDTYDEYVAHLADGGQKASSALSQVTAEISKVEAAMQHMSGARLTGMESMLTALQDAQKILKSWAAEDVWNATAQKVQQLADKYTTEFGAMNAATLDWVNMALAAARDVPAALNKIKPEDLLKNWLEGEQKLEESTRRLNENLTKAWDKWREGVEKSVVPIVATLDQRLANVDVTLQGISKDSESAFRTSEIGQYLDMVKSMNAEGLKTVQQIESQIASQQNLLDKMRQMHQPLIEQEQLQEKIITEQIRINELQGQSVTTLIEGLDRVRLAQATTLDTANQQWSKVSATLQQLAKSDLPGVIALYEQYEGILRNVGASEGEVLSVQEDRLNTEIRIASENGKDATAQVVALHNVQLAHQALRDQAVSTGQMITHIQDAVIKGWNDTGKAIADCIVEGNNLEQALMSVIKNIAKSIAEELVGKAFKDFKNSLQDINGQVGAIDAAFRKLGNTVTGTIGGSGEVAREGHGLPTAGHPELPGEGSGEAAGAGGAASQGGILGSLGGMANALNLVLTLINDILQDIQLAHLNKTMGKVEENTRFLEIKFAKFAEQDEWQRHDEILSKWDMNYTRLGDVWGELVRLKDTINMTDSAGQIEWLWQQQHDLFVGQFNSYINLWGKTNDYLNRMAGVIDPGGAQFPSGSTSTTGNVIKDNGWLWSQMQPMLVAQYNANQSVFHSMDDHLKTATDTYLKNIQDNTASAKTWLVAIGGALGAVPKFASGTAYVPHDMLAVVHQGEAIIPADQVSGATTTATQFPSIMEGPLSYAHQSTTTAAAAAPTVAHIGMSDAPLAYYTQQAAASPAVSQMPAVSLPTIASGNQLAQMATALPAIPTSASSSTMLASSTGPDSISNTNTYGSVTQNIHIQVNESSNPRETARQLALTLKTLTGRLGPGTGS